VLRSCMGTCTIARPSSRDYSSGWALPLISTVKIAIIGKQKKPFMGFCSGENYGIEIKGMRLGRDEKGAGHGHRGTRGRNETTSDR